MKDTEVFLCHIIESINKIQNHTKQMRLADFLKDIKAQDAVIRRLQILGEATKNIPKSFRNEFENIPWRSMMGLRDVLVHDYFGIDLKLVWRIVRRKLPPLKMDIQNLLIKFDKCG